MGVLNKDYKITVDIRTGSIQGDGIIFAAKDQNVSNVKIHFIREGHPIDITGVSLLAHVQKPDTLKTPIEIDILDSINGIGELELPLSLTTEVGSYNFEIEMAKGEEVSHTYAFSYTVRDTLCGEWDESIFEDENYNLLIKLAQDVNELESKITIGEENRELNETERRISEASRIVNERKRVEDDIVRGNTINDKLLTMDNKMSEVEDRFVRLTSSQQQDAEVILARESIDGIIYESLKARLDKLELGSYILFETIEG